MVRRSYGLLFAALAPVILVACTGSDRQRPDVDGGPSADDAGADVTAPVAAKCGATPTQLVDFNALATQNRVAFIGAMQLALDGTNVYFVFGDQLMRVPISGGAALGSKLGLDPNGFQSWDPVATPAAVVLHYLVPGDVNSDERIVAVPPQGGTETVLATSHGSVWSLTADQNNAYFADSMGIQRVPLAGGDVQLLDAQASMGGAEVGGLAIVGSNVVATSAAQDGEVIGVPIQRGTATILATGQPGARFPMACGSDTCWWEGGSETAMGAITAPGYIARLTGAAVTTIPGRVYPWSLTFDGSDFFETVGCDACAGTLVRIPASGAPPVEMGSAGFIAVDEQCAYFSVVLGDSTLPSQTDGGLPGTGIYSVVKSYASP